MYLKNTSKTVTVMLNTVVGRICMKPGEVINLEHKLLPPVSANIKKTTEEEFRKFCNPEEALEDTNVDIQETQTIITAINGVKCAIDVTIPLDNTPTIRFARIQITPVTNIPNIPDAKPIIIDSALNKWLTSFFLPPSERITPISFVRSTTDT